MDNSDVKSRLLALIHMKHKVRALCDTYEEQMILFVTGDDDNIDDPELRRNISLMRSIEHRVYKKVITDLEHILSKQISISGDIYNETI